MKKCGVFCFFFWMLLTPQHVVWGQQNYEKLFLSIRELSASDPEDAELRLRKYIRAGIRIHSEEISAKSYYLLGRINYFKSRHYLSNRYYTLALGSPYAAHDASFAESCYNNLGVSYEMQNLFPQALEAYQKSLYLAQQLKDSVSIGQSWINIGLLNAKISKFDKARQLTMQALAFFSRLEDVANEALCYQNLGFIMSEQQKKKEAIGYYHTCLALHERAGNQYETVNLLFNLAANYSEISKQPEAETYLKRTLEIALLQNRTDIVARIYTQMAENNIEAGNYRLAEANLQEAAKLGSSADDSYDSGRLILQGFRKLYAKSGNYAAYKAILAKMDEMDRMHSHDKMIARTDELQAFYDFQGNMRKIKGQAMHIDTKRQQARILGAVFVFFALVLLFAVFQYLKVRRYMRSLFKNKVQQTLLEDRSVAEAFEQQTSRQYLKDVHDQVLRFLEQTPGDRDLSVAALSKELHLREEHIVQAIRAFGSNYNAHVFFQAFFIDELCKQMIRQGKNVSLRTSVANSPFQAFGDFVRKFREMTGLRPRQFLHYCEVRLKGKL